MSIPDFDVAWQKLIIDMYPDFETNDNSRIVNML